jgi:hypothetical protein
MTHSDRTGDWFTIGIVAAFTLSGAALIRLRPRNLIGWLLLACGRAAGGANQLRGVRRPGADRPGRLTAVRPARHVGRVLDMAARVAAADACSASALPHRQAGVAFLALAHPGVTGRHWPARRDRRNEPRRHRRHRPVGPPPMGCTGMVDVDDRPAHRGDPGARDRGVLGWHRCPCDPGPWPRASATGLAGLRRRSDARHRRPADRLPAAAAGDRVGGRGRSVRSRIRLCHAGFAPPGADAQRAEGIAAVAKREI